MLGFWGKVEAIALELAVENSFMKGRIKELESMDRKTYVGIVGRARCGQYSKEVPRRKEMYSVMFKSKAPGEDGDNIYNLLSFFTPVLLSESGFFSWCLHLPWIRLRC
ncbi:hypothetical protein Zmor_015811 [Zophobas morio]|uniref:Uncharacterized protein n=1 Tax=Zophobas morio TaxID=2755281 RepID=A0AA38IHG9_9CUCU|nr:hypothetical protein Zmor_025233 [Zophobas morio]KAJ3656762.1 hypothetical protein Zmor_015811 [Zophobas morio]